MTPPVHCEPAGQFEQDVLPKVEALVCPSGHGAQLVLHVPVLSLKYPFSHLVQAPPEYFDSPVRS